MKIKFVPSIFGVLALGGVAVVLINSTHAQIRVRPPLAVTGKHYDTVASRDRIYRIDMNSGATDWCFYDLGTRNWTWKSLPEAPGARLATSEGRYQMLAGNSITADFMRVDRVSGATWLLKPTGMLPSWEQISTQ